MESGCPFNVSQKPIGLIEEVDLVTPVRNEKEEAPRENGSDDYRRNGSSGDRYSKSYNRSYKLKNVGQVAPAGYESDLSDDLNELELG